MHEDEVYRTFSSYLKERYGKKVYKLPIALPVTCPNRDGKLGTGGCTFCGSIGAGYEDMPPSVPIAEQIRQNKAHIVPKYKAELFIPYFQNFTNTYAPTERLRDWIDEAAAGGDIAAIYISTRPDCVSEENLTLLEAAQEKYGIDICVELGLQSTNAHTLAQINRGHSLAEFIDAVLRIRAHHLQSCAHIIIGLPGEDRLDILEDAKVLSALRVDQVKLHALYLVKGTEMARQYEAGEIELISREEYEARVILFLEHLASRIVVQRLIGRAPASHTIMANWHTGWWKIRDHIVDVMRERGTYQGRLCNYLNGSALRR